MLQKISIGELKTHNVLVKLMIKLHVVHAGLLQLSVHYHIPVVSKKLMLNISDILNNMLLLVIKVILVVMVVMLKNH